MLCECFTIATSRAEVFLGLGAGLLMWSWFDQFQHERQGSNTHVEGPHGLIDQVGW